MLYCLTELSSVHQLMITLVTSVTVWVPPLVLHQWYVLKLDWYPPIIRWPHMYLCHSVGDLPVVYQVRGAEHSESSPWPIPTAKNIKQFLHISSTKTNKMKPFRSGSVSLALSNWSWHLYLLREQACVQIYFWFYIKSTIAAIMLHFFYIIYMMCSDAPNTKKY